MDKPRVKPLVWRVDDSRTAYAQTSYFVDRYCIEHRLHADDAFDLWIGPDAVRATRFPTLETAKAAAQADYEARILAALEPMEIPKKTLKPFWQDKLNRRMEDVFPDVIGEGDFVQSWKQDGWNDGTTTLFGVYLCGGQYVMCAFPDYREPRSNVVNPRFEHTDWDIVGHKDAE